MKRVMIVDDEQGCLVRLNAHYVGKVGRCWRLMIR